MKLVELNLQVGAYKSLKKMTCNKMNRINECYQTSNDGKLHGQPDEIQLLSVCFIYELDEYYSSVPRI